MNGQETWSHCIKCMYFYYITYYVFIVFGLCSWVLGKQLELKEAPVSFRIVSGWGKFSHPVFPPGRTHTHYTHAHANMCESGHARRVFKLLVCRLVRLPEKEGGLASGQSVPGSPDTRTGTSLSLSLFPTCLCILQLVWFSLSSKTLSVSIWHPTLKGEREEEVRKVPKETGDLNSWSILPHLDPLTY